MAEVTFDDLREVPVGARITITDGSEVLDGTFHGLLPGKEGGKGREKHDAAIVKQGALIAYVRRPDACAIKIDKRTGQRRRR